MRRIVRREWHGPDMADSWSQESPLKLMLRPPYLDIENELDQSALLGRILRSASQLLDALQRRFVLCLRLDSCFHER